ncbi:hypothetical protein [Variovorax sp. LjRoot175]
MEFTMSQNWKFETLSIHTYSPDPGTRAVAPPIYMRASRPMRPW